MDQAPEMIRQQIDQTRSSLTEKLETLEHQVRDTVTSAKSTVDETIQNVKSTMHETVESVKRAFDLKHQVEQHPWAMFGGSVVAGYLLGTFLPKQLSARADGHLAVGLGRDGPARAAAMAPRSEVEQPVGDNFATAPTQSATAARPSLLSRFVHQFDDEIEEVKEIAIGAAMGVLHDLIKDALPQYRSEIGRLIDSATVKLGGKPLARTSSGAESRAAYAPPRR
jgi:ElaB/YqjD/DUF883 family membrane-anchored ribosome-binding protein